MEKKIKKTNDTDDVLFIPRKLLCGKEKEITISLLCPGNNELILVLPQLILHLPEVDKVEEEEVEEEGKEI